MIHTAAIALFKSTRITHINLIFSLLINKPFFEKWMLQNIPLTDSTRKLFRKILEKQRRRCYFPYLLIFNVVDKMVRLLSLLSKQKREKKRSLLKNKAKHPDELCRCTLRNK